jgi:aminoglycoside phosphotransferase (APT) family kinase protein
VTAPDKTVDVREEDRFDIYAAHNWLASRVDGLDGRPRSCNFPAAHSNFTYLLTYLGRELILHRPPTGSKAASAHDIRRESACKLSAAAGFFLCAGGPRVLRRSVCPPAPSIGSPTYYRFHHGDTHNSVFKDFWQFVGYLDRRCREVIKKGRA